MTPTPDYTIIDVRIEGDPPRFVATTPHLPHLRAESTHEHDCVNAIAVGIRSHRAPFEAAGEPVPWRDPADPMAGKDKSTHRRLISGLRPVKTTELTEQPDAAQLAAADPNPAPSRKRGTGPGPA